MRSRTSFSFSATAVNMPRWLRLGSNYRVVPGQIQWSRAINGRINLCTFSTDARLGRFTYSMHKGSCCWWWCWRDLPIGFLCGDTLGIETQTSASTPRGRGRGEHPIWYLYSFSERPQRWNNHAITITIQFMLLLLLLLMMMMMTVMMRCRCFLSVPIYRQYTATARTFTDEAKKVPAKTLTTTYI